MTERNLACGEFLKTVNWMTAASWVLGHTGSEHFIEASTMSLKNLLRNPLVALSTLLALSGCGGHDGGTAAGASPTLAGRFAYAANFNQRTISMFTVDAATRELRHQGDVAAGAGPIDIAVDPSGRFVYVANNLSNN